MARFCTQCGTPAANDAVKFCSKCGAPLPAAAAPSPEQVAQTAPPPSPPPVAPVASAPAAAKGTSPVVKIVVGVLAFFVVIGVLALGTCVFLVHKAKQKVEQAKTEYGLGENSGPVATARDVCSLITKEEVSQLTGVEITDAQGSTSKCTYSSANNPVVLETDVSWEGGKLGLKLGVAALRGMGGVDTIIQLPGIGDEAYTIGLKGKPAEDMRNEAEKDQSGTVKGMAHVMAESPLMFRKADVMVTVRLTEAGDPDAAKQGIAKIIASQL
jgi:hypothetical protein